jgi:hypothetical protein
MKKKDELNQVEAKLVTLLKSSDPIRSGSLWQDMHSTLSEMVCEAKEDRVKRVPELLIKLRNLQEECKEDMTYWDELFRTLDRRNTLKGIKSKK